MDFDKEIADLFVGKIIDKHYIHNRFAHLFDVNRKLIESIENYINSTKRVEKMSNESKIQSDVLDAVKKQCKINHEMYPIIKRRIKDFVNLISDHPIVGKNCDIYNAYLKEIEENVNTNIDFKKDYFFDATPIDISTLRLFSECYLTGKKFVYDYEKLINDTKKAYERFNAAENVIVHTDTKNIVDAMKKLVKQYSDEWTQLRQTCCIIKHTADDPIVRRDVDTC